MKYKYKDVTSIDSPLFEKEQSTQVFHWIHDVNQDETNSLTAVSLVISVPLSHDLDPEGSLGESPTSHHLLIGRISLYKDSSIFLFTGDGRD